MDSAALIAWAVVGYVLTGYTLIRRDQLRPVYDQPAYVRQRNYLWMGLVLVAWPAMWLLMKLTAVSVTRRWQADSGMHPPVFSSFLKSGVVAVVLALFR
jgi:hypothetical protein